MTCGRLARFFTRVEEAAREAGVIAYVVSVAHPPRGAAGDPCIHADAAIDLHPCIEEREITAAVLVSAADAVLTEIVAELDGGGDA